MARQRALDKAQVKLVKQAHKKGAKKVELAAQFEVSPAVITKAILGLGAYAAT